MPLIVLEMVSSPSLRKCSKEAYRYWPWMLLACDDGGRFMVDLDEIKREVFHYMPDVEAEHIGQWIHEYESVNQIRTWRVGDHTYAGVVEWCTYQKGMRRMSSAIPNPDGSVLEGDYTRKEWEPFHEAAVKPSRVRVVEDKPTEEPVAARHHEPVAPTQPEERVVPAEIVHLAEQLIGGPLSSSDGMAIRRWLWAEKYPADWVEAALARAIEQQPSGRKMAYAEAILKGYTKEGGPSAPKDHAADRKERQARTKEERERQVAEKRAEADKAQARAIASRQADLQARESRVDAAVDALSDGDRQRLESQAVEVTAKLFGRRLPLTAAPVRSCFRSLVAEHIGLPPIDEEVGL